jgi:hypothetical protein
MAPVVSVVSAVPVVSATTVTSQDDPAAKIVKLKALHDAGAISDKEFADKKAELLGRL